MKTRTPSARILSSVMGIAVLATFFIGCATTVRFQVQQPPVWNTLGIQRLAIMPFTTADNSALQRHAANLLTNESQQSIQATNHFTLVNSAEVARVRAANGDIGTVADAIFSGHVVSISVQDSSSQETRVNRDRSVTQYMVFRRDVQMTFSYNLTRAGRGADLIGSNTRANLTSSHSTQNRGELRPAEAMVQEIIQRNMRGIASYVAPHMVTQQRKIESEPSRDRDVRQRAKDAEALIKAGSYRIAQDAFLGIYRDTGSFAAALNAALLKEVQGDLEGAASFMQTVHNATGNPRAANEIARLRRVMDNMGLLEAYAQNIHQRDRVIALMVDTLPSRMPANPRVALMNNSQNERDLVELVITGIIDGFLANNIIVVDRANRALVEMERNYQLLGHVRDEEMISIGQEAGVNAFILVAITGTGAIRRLSVRMLDVERNTVIYQSPNTDEMNL